jgi:hypothetical protein
MPFIHINSLPFEKSVEMKAVLEGISEGFSLETEIALEHVTATWNFSCELFVDSLRLSSWRESQR